MTEQIGAGGGYPGSQKSRMDPTARRCVGWAVACLVIGSLVVAIFPPVLMWLATSAGQPGQVLLTVVEPVVAILRWSLFPLGAALIGAAVVIQWLATRLRLEVRQRR